MNANELLERALKALDGWLLNTNLCAEIRAYLTAQEADVKSEQEPVAWLADSPTLGNGKRVFINLRTASTYSSDVQPLYLHPVPAKQPLTDREISEEELGFFLGNATFKAGVRFAEKHHGIGEINE